MRTYTEVGKEYAKEDIDKAISMIDKEKKEKTELKCPNPAIKCGKKTIRTRVDGTHICIACGYEWKN